jgi:hypothetical protein
MTSSQRDQLDRGRQAASQLLLLLDAGVSVADALGDVAPDLSPAADPAAADVARRAIDDVSYALSILALLLGGLVPAAAIKASKIRKGWVHAPRPDPDECAAEDLGLEPPGFAVKAALARDRRKAGS